jgi:molecular chaperone GrpE (heat shock protein)
MAEQENGKGGFFSKILRNSAPPDIETLIANGVIPPGTQMPVPRGHSPASAVLEAPNGTGENGDTLEQQMEYLHAGMAQVFDLIVALHEKEAAHERVFDTLYKELHEYKNDFVYERLKPIVRPLLFLMDSLEQFQQEVKAGGETISAKTVNENLQHFMDQLHDALAIGEAQPLEKPTGEFDPKSQKAVEVVPVPNDENNQIQRVVRSGWTLNGEMLRPTEVVVGKAR